MPINTAKPRLPSIPHPTRENIEQVLSSIKELIDLREARSPRANELDQIVTKRDLFESGFGVRIGGKLYSITAPGTGDAKPITLPVAGSTAVDSPTAPTGLSAQGALANIILDWDEPLFRGFAYTEIFRAAVNTLGLAVKHGETQANVFSDATGSTGVTYYYWVRHVNTNGDIGPFNAVNGVSATTTLVQTVDVAAEAITAAKLGDSSVISSRIGTQNFFGSNEVRNPSFEQLAPGSTEPDAWAKTEGTGATIEAADDVNAPHGDRVLKISGVAPVSYQFVGCRGFAVTPGKVYAISYKWRTSAGLGSDFIARVIGSSSRPAGGKYISLDGWNNEHATDLFWGSVPATYTAKEHTWTCPAGIYWAQIQFAGRPDDTLWIDEVDFRMQLTDNYIKELNAGKLNAGFISADRIQAGSITAQKIAAYTLTVDRLVVADFTNLVPNPVFQKGASNFADWFSAIGPSQYAVLNHTDVGVPANAPAVKVLRLSTVIGQNNDIYAGSLVSAGDEDNMFDVVPGETFYVSAQCASSSDQNTQFDVGLHFVKKDGTTQDWRVANSKDDATGTPATRVGGAGATSWALVEGRVKVPADYYKASFWCRVLSHPTAPAGFWYMTQARVRKSAGTAYIEDLSVENAKIADLAVTNAKIGALAVDSAKIADAAIVTAKIADLQVTGAKIADATIGNAKITDLAAGKITAGTIAAALTMSDEFVVSTLGKIRGGQTAYRTGQGFFLGYSGAAYKFSIGNPNVAELYWDGSELRVYGNIFPRNYVASSSFTVVSGSGTSNRIVSGFTESTTMKAAQVVRYGTVRVSWDFASTGNAWLFRIYTTSGGLVSNVSISVNNGSHSADISVVAFDTIECRAYCNEGTSRSIDFSNFQVRTDQRLVEAVTVDS